VQRRCDKLRIGGAKRRGRGPARGRRRAACRPALQTVANRSRGLGPGA